MSLHDDAPVLGAHEPCKTAHGCQKGDLNRAALVAPAVLSEWSPLACSVAAEQGNLQLLQQLLALQPAYHWDQDVSFQAAAHGHLMVLQWLLTQHCPFNPLRCILRAATEGHLAVINWLRQLVPRYFEPDQAMQLAASAGDLHAMQSLRLLDPPCAWDAATSRAAAREGHLHILEWMHGQSPQCLLDVTVYEEAALHGQLQVLQWLHEQHPFGAWTETICRMAAQGGHIDMLAWLRSLQPTHTLAVSVCGAAAASGQLRVLEWLRHQDPPSPWDESASWHAAAGGHLEVLQWLRDPSHGQPCTWDRGVAISATISGHLSILQWIHEVAPFSLIDYWAAITACTYQQPHILEWLLQEPALSDASLQDLCNHPGHRRFLMQSLHAHGLTGRQSQDSLLVPASMGDVTIMQHIMPELKARGLVLQALQRAIAGGSLSKPALDQEEAEAGYWKGQATMADHADHLQVARQLLEQLPRLGSSDSDLLAADAIRHCSIIPVQLAFMGVQPRIEWGSETHSLAAAHGQHALLRWLLAQPCQPKSPQVHPGCSTGRMLLLVHGHGWKLPDPCQDQMLAAEQRHHAFYGAVQHLRRRVPALEEEELSLGDLPQSIIEKIACLADIDFSWAHPM